MGRGHHHHRLGAGHHDGPQLGAHAQFSFTAAFTTEAAALDLLGAAALSAAQRAVLDGDGNDNGTYDLGDFLAWIDRTAQGVPPALMARLMAAAGPTTAPAPKGVTP